MKKIIIFILMSFLSMCVPNEAYAQPTTDGVGLSISDLLDGDPDYPVMTLDKKIIVTENQMNLIVTYLEDRIDMKMKLNTLQEDLKIQELLNLDQKDLSEGDRVIIKSLTDLLDVKEKQTLNTLDRIDYNLKEVKLILGDERDSLKAKNKRLKWMVGILTTALGTTTYLLITK